MKILVTGGAGFIGSHIVDAYIGEGHDVIIYDDLSSGKKEYINSKAVLVQADINNGIDLGNTFARYGPFDIVNHLAAQKSVTHSVDDPIEDARINIIGSLNLLEACRANHVEQFVFSSTGGALYGETTVLPTPEDSRIVPESPYGIAKYSVENYLRFYQSFGLKTKVLRYANVYGPRQDPAGEAGVVAIFIQKILKGEPLTIFGDGNQTRDFIYVADVVRANLLAVAKVGSGVWNIGTAKETSVNEVCRQLFEIQSIGQGKIEYRPGRAGELKRSSISVDLATKELGLSNLTSLAEGLKKTIASFKGE